MSKILELAKRIASTGGLETKTTETISGTYDSAGQQRLLSHAYTIGANLTITNGELILSRLADNGTGMTVEFGSDVTLSGDGTLMLGDLGQGQPNQDFSASRITGKLPSTVFPTGMVIQVIHGFTSTETGSTNNTYKDTGLEATLTPSSVSSKIAISMNINGVQKETNNAYINLKAMYNVAGGSYTDIAQFGARLGMTGDSSKLNLGTCALNYLLSPNTTSAVNIKAQFHSAANNSGVGVQEASSMSTIMLMEIAG